ALRGPHPMDTPERPEESLPTWPSAPKPALPIRPGWDGPDGPAAAPRGPVSPKLVLHAFRRHWWQILALWLVASGGLGYLAYTKIRPNYESVAWLKLEPNNQGLLGGNTGGDFAQQLDTHVQLITSPEVLSTTAQDPKVSALPRIRTALDAEAELRKEV